MNNRSKNSTSTSETSKRSEPEWVAADDGEPSAEPRIEHVDEPDIDVYQPGPDEPVWAPAEPVAASDDASAGDVPAAKRKRTQRKPRGQVAAKEPAPTVTLEVDAATPVEPNAEQAASTTAVAKRKPSARVKKESSSTPSPEPRATSGPTPVAANETPSEAPVSVGKKKRGKQGSDQQPTTPIVAEPDPPIASEAVAVAPTDAPTEPASSMPSMEQFIAELATLSVPQLVKRHVEQLGTKPRIKNRVWLQRKLSWHEQTRRFGGLSVAAKRRLTQLMGEIELPAPTSRTPKADAPATRRADDLPLGTRLERKWRDRVIVAMRVEGGWDCEGAIYRTLSAAAKAVSGSHVSGPAWFGIWRPKGGTR
jgi:hypothetical protein